MNELIGEVITCTTPQGDIIAKLESFDDGIFTLGRPRLFVVNGEGQGVLLPGINGTCFEYPAKAYISVNSVGAFAQAKTEAVNAWMNSEPENDINKSNVQPLKRLVE